MTKEIAGVLRHVLTTAGGFVFANGTVSSTELEMAVGALVTLFGFAWSLYEKRSRA